MDGADRAIAKSLSRRTVLKLLAAAGLGHAAVPLVQADDEPAVTRAMLDEAEWITGIDFTEEERELMLGGVEEMQRELSELRSLSLDNSVAPALVFDPSGGERAPAALPRRAASLGPAVRWAPRNEEELAHAPIARLSAALRSREISSTDLTRLSLERLKRHDPTLRCVITLTEELALEQAKRADAELDEGHWRGPLHGIPWGAKDLLAVPGYRTTWGATPFRDQRREETATVVQRLEQAGAVLVAKLSLGALAWGDVWFDGMTRNPWKVAEGSSGSSAGPASATAAGLVGFAMGSETLGSIISPCTRCGVTGLRPTFGRVSRHGAMALSWSMDKLGPIARSAEDCALVFDAIHGADGKDASVVDRPFDWPMKTDATRLRIGYVPELFERERSRSRQPERLARAREWQAFDQMTLEVLRAQGFDLVPIALPSRHPVGPLSLILTAEAACAFDELTRNGRDDELVRQVRNAWPNVLRQGQLIPAVEYIRANRVRSLLVDEMRELFESVDVYVTPSYGGNNLLLTNLTGHPAVVLPNGFRSSDGTPTSITFTGKLFGETELLAVAQRYQQATEFHRRRPELAESGA